jgi:hypothetical protein
MPLALVAPPPQATSRRAVASHGCAPASSCSPYTSPPPPALLRPSPSVFPDVLCSNSRQGRRAQIRLKAGAYLHCHRLK